VSQWGRFPVTHFYGIFGGALLRRRSDIKKTLANQKKCDKMAKD
jgi:hypothetical protein